MQASNWLTATQVSHLRPRWVVNRSQSEGFGGNTANIGGAAARDMDGVLLGRNGFYIRQMPVSIRRQHTESVSRKPHMAHDVIGNDQNEIFYGHVVPKTAKEDLSVA